MKNTPSGVLRKSCQKQLQVTARAGVNCDLSCLLVRIWAGLIEAGNSAVDHNKVFIIHTFFRPSAEFEVDEDRLGSRYTLFVCLCIHRLLDRLNPMCITAI